MPSVFELRNQLVVVTGGTPEKRQKISTLKKLYLDFGDVFAAYQTPDAISPNGAILVFNYGKPVIEPLKNLNTPFHPTHLGSPVNADLAAGVRFKVGENEISIRTIDIKKVA